MFNTSPRESRANVASLRDAENAARGVPSDLAPTSRGFASSACRRSEKDKQHWFSRLVFAREAVVRATARGPRPTKAEELCRTRMPFGTDRSRWRLSSKELFATDQTERFPRSIQGLPGNDEIYIDDCLQTICSYQIGEKKCFEVAAA